MRAAEDIPSLDFETVSTYWGKQIGLCGEYGTFRVHPVWHRIRDNSIGFYYTSGSPNDFYGEGIQTNNGECILAMPYLHGYPLNDPEAFPTYDNVASYPLKRFIESDKDGASAADVWSPYEWFEYKKKVTSTPAWPTNRPTGFTAATSYNQTTHFGDGTDPITFTNGSATNSFNGYGLATSSGSPLTSGIYYADYEDPGSYSFGLLNHSDQRKAVMTGNILHGVFESGGVVYYSMSKGASGADWLYPIKLDAPTTGVTQTRPAIGVYQKGDGYGFCGQAAVAVAWAEIHSIGGSLPLPFNSSLSYMEVQIKMKTREFNICDGSWGPWSSSYVIHTHYFVNGSTYGTTTDDMTTPVIAPLVQDVTTPTPVISRSSNLLGWTITWSSPEIDVNAIVKQYANGSLPLNLQKCLLNFNTAMYSRSLLRYGLESSGGTGDVVDNYSWGGWTSSGYPNSSTVAGSSYAGIQPLNSAGLPWNLLHVTNGCDGQNPIQFPTVTANENKKTDGTETESQEVSYSTDGRFSGIWAFQTAYALSGTIGSISSTSTIYNLTVEPPCPSCPPSEPSYPSRMVDRNPCVTVNSAGERFVAWERMIGSRQPDGDGGFHYVYSSEIDAAKTYYDAYGHGTWVNSGGLKDVKTLYAAVAGDMTWSWLLNPSITGFPKSRLFYDGIAIPNHDPAAIELGFWLENAFGSPYTPNSAITRLYGELSPGVGTWLSSSAKKTTLWRAGAGEWTQRSFGQYNEGPTYTTGGLPPTNFLTPDLGLSYLLANDPTLGITVVDHLVNGSYKGTFDSVGLQNVYRSELYMNDTNYARFVFGNVFVGDSTHTNPVRQVMMHTWHLDTTSGWTSHTAMRDSIFRTETFDWPMGSEISFYRGVLTSDSLAFRFYPGAASGGSFSDTSIRLRYTFELVNENGNVTPVEALTFSPGNSQFAIPKYIIVVNDSAYVRNVYLRATTSHTGVSDNDSAWEFQDVMADTGVFQAYADSTMSLKHAVAIAGSSTHLQVAGPFPSINIGGGERTELLFAYSPHNDVAVRVFDILGRQVGETMHSQSLGSWQPINIVTPETAGKYFVRVSAGNDTKTAELVVLK
jgi:hypothetical protein